MTFDPTQARRQLRQWRDSGELSGMGKTVGMAIVSLAEKHRGGEFQVSYKVIANNAQCVLSVAKHWVSRLGRLGFVAWRRTRIRLDKLRANVNWRNVYRLTFAGQAESAERTTNDIEESSLESFLPVPRAPESKAAQDESGATLFPASNEGTEIVATVAGGAESATPAPIVGQRTGKGGFGRLGPLSGGLLALSRRLAGYGGLGESGTDSAVPGPSPVSSVCCRDSGDDLRPVTNCATLATPRCQGSGAHGNERIQIPRKWSRDDPAVLRNKTVVRDRGKAGDRPP